jgi:two-component system, OmpR family, response regulator
LAALQTVSSIKTQFGLTHSNGQTYKYAYRLDFNPNTNVVDVCIQRIRKKIDAMGAAD